MTPHSTSLLERLQKDVKDVEAVLESIIASRVSLVQEVSSHTLRSGGKRIRPALVMISAEATKREFSRDRALRLGAVMEMVHMATLIHDDVIDHADTRRGTPTAARVFGNTSAILAGDVLLSRAMTVLAKDGDLDIIRVVAQSVTDLAEGETLELELRSEYDLSLQDYQHVLDLKTASFIACCCRVGGMVAGASEAVQEALSEYGMRIGYAFQIADDLLDYRGDTTDTGKPRATDFREGCLTLPLLYLRETLSEDEGAFARNKFGTNIHDDEVALICGWMQDRGAFARAEAEARNHAALAVDALNALPDSNERQALVELAEFILSRKS